MNRTLWIVTLPVLSCLASAGSGCDGGTGPAGTLPGGADAAAGAAPTRLAPGVTVTQGGEGTIPTGASNLPDAGAMPSDRSPDGVAPVSGGGTAALLGAETFNATSSSLSVRWVSPQGGTAARVVLAPEPPPADGVAMPAEGKPTALAATPSQATLSGLAPATDWFLRVEVDTPQGTVSQVVHGRTLGGPRAPLDDAVREVHALGPAVLQIVLYQGDGPALQAGPWTVTRGDGRAIPVTRVSRHSVPISMPRYSVGWGIDYSDTYVEADHRIALTLGEPLGPGPDLLSVTGPTGIAFTLPFSDRYLETPAIQLNQVGYNPRATERWAYVSGYLGDGGALSLDGFPATADVLAEPSDDTRPRAAVVAGLAVTQRSAGDDDVGGAVDQIDLSTVPAAEGVRLRVRLPGVGVSWPTQVSEIAAFKALFVVQRGLFFNRWGQDTGAVLKELARPSHPTRVFTGELADFLGYYQESDPQSAPRTLSAGFMDAGNFQQRPMHQVIPQLLMRAFEVQPSVHADGQLDLPESGNGIPDVLDQALWGIEAWRQLQEADGGVRQGVNTYRNIYGFFTADQDPLSYWTFARCPNASARAAGLFAQMSRLLAPWDAGRAADLADRAASAFAYAQANGAASAFLLYGAAELFRLTGDGRYDTAFQAAWNAIGPYGAFSNLAEFHLLESDYAHPGQVMPDYFLDYLAAPGASADIVSKATASLTNEADKWTRAAHENHAHRSPRPANYQWDWGMGTGTARYMDTVIARMQLGGLAAADRQRYFDALSLSADYVLGGNPDGMVYFTLLGSRHPMEPLHLDSLAWIKEGKGTAQGVPVYGPIDSLPNAPYMAAPAAVFHPDFSSQPKGRRYGDVRAFVNTNEFSVWEVSGPFAELFSILVGPGMKPPATWLTGGEHVLDPLP